MKISTEEFNYKAMKTAANVISRMPAWLTIGVARSVGSCLFILSKRRHTAYADIKAVFGGRYTARQRWQLVRRHYEYLAQSAIELIQLSRVSRDQIRNMVEADHPERLYETTGKKKGTIFLTAHFGNFELLQVYSGTIGLPLHVLGREQKHKALYRVLLDYRESQGSSAVGQGMNLRDLIRALKKGEIVGILGDQSAGRDQGVILPFLGRKTTLPTGAFEVAARTGALILPCFIFRDKKGRHRLTVREAIECPTDTRDPEALRPVIEEYLAIVEGLIREYPEQWFWTKKRWKYSWTKRLIILSDGKAGHVKQSEAVARNFQRLPTQYGRSGMEYPTQTINVEYKSPWHRKVFPWFALFFIPWAQGRMGWLKLFFKHETQKQLEASSADFIISAGSSLTPLNQCLARESHAKSLVLMKPSFPFNLFRYDLALIPAHDKGVIPRESIRTVLTPNVQQPEDFAKAGEMLKKELKAPERVKISVFIGGSTKKYRLDLAGIEKLLAVLKRQAPALGDFVLTTSRRTPDGIARFLKEDIARFSTCQMFVDAHKDVRPHIVPGMLAISDILIVTEDSISMISEAVSTGKKVIVLCLDSKRLPSKHRRFRQYLEQKSAILATDIDSLEKHLSESAGPGASELVANESLNLQQKLQEIL